jgi:hypothetical protein
MQGWLAMRLDGGCGCAESSAMANIWKAAASGDLAEVKRLVGQEPGLLNAQEYWILGGTPLMSASKKGHVGGALAARQGGGRQRAE